MKEWISNDGFFTFNIGLHLKNAGQNSQWLDRSFFDAIMKRKDEIDKAIWKILALQLALLAFLVLHIFGLKPSFSFGGISVASPDILKEIVLIHRVLNNAFSLCYAKE